jgi:quercetin dioxygenase-like cupin family protein
MIAVAKEEVKATPVQSVVYKGATRTVRDVTIQWLSQAGKDPRGAPAYGLRLFTVGPGGEIPTHSHEYVQTMYILSGSFECWIEDPETDKIVDRRIVGPNDVVYVPGEEPHGMRNTSDTERGTFLCCIGNVTESSEDRRGCC